MADIHHIAQGLVAEAHAQHEQIEAKCFGKVCEEAAAHSADRAQLQRALGELYAAVFEAKTVSWKDIAPAIHDLQEKLAAARGETDQELRRRLGR